MLTRAPHTFIKETKKKLYWKSTFKRWSAQISRFFVEKTIKRYPFV